MEDLNEIVEKFISVEDRNFALFNYVNEQNAEVEMLQEKIQEVRIKKYKYCFANCFHKINHILMI